ncbi:MAG: folylpolyglutamate synthase/dihydrofolate synthase family protein [Pseudomonadota bacterium]
MPPTLSTAEARILALMERHPPGFDLGLERMERLLAALNDPHKRLPPVIHVAGTNGKGSTVAFCRAIAESAGLRVHVDTSPHLVRWHERFRIAGTLVDDDVLGDALERVDAANGEEPITVFELLTVVAFLLFAEHPADLCLIEVGLGGRLDCTNVIEDSAVSVITPVSKDHEAFLGDTLTKIAFEKAGIIKRRGQVVIAPQEPSALATIEQQAARQGASVVRAGEHYFAQVEAGRLLVETDDQLYDLPLPRLAGPHQIENAATAVMAMRTFARVTGTSIPHVAMEAGLRTADWPARMQPLSRGALLALLPEGSDLWLDGGHNPAAARRACEFLADLEEREPKPLVLIAGMLNTKDTTRYFEPFADLVRRVITVPVPSSDAGVPPDDLVETAKAAGLDAMTADDVPTALMLIARSENAPVRVLICGSLYLAGTVLALNGTPPT